MGSTAEDVGLLAEVVLLVAFETTYKGIQQNIIYCTLFGFTTALAATSAYVLLRNGVKDRCSQLLLAATVILYASTTVFFAFSVVGIFLNTNVYVNPSYLNCDWSAGFCTSISHSQLKFSWYIALVITATLMINMFVGDCIVWWRACAIWGYDRRVAAAGSILISLSFALGVVATAHTTPTTITGIEGQSTQYFVRDKEGFASVVISLSTNALATILIAIKTWKHSKFLKAYIANASSASRAIGTLVILVESGFGYCAIWAFATAIYGAALMPQDVTPHSFTGVASSLTPFLPSILIPTIAAYPMAIIIIVAMRRSPLDQLNRTASRALSSRAPGHVSTDTRDNGSSIELGMVVHKTIHICRDEGSPYGVRAETIDSRDVV
ncbi:uncharacterized protein BXZ73DRAFT_99916 [Epithele typhae]|uniref:uncharacterized protein n=1 Tax=Epithele typhae TaxID=378194 RepID=UPI0020073718|nr:uncharacterized protein BXZ73DRAFT_99916 [Epithele typhae]KAH9938857.1 hypothetical protein BXZ73DRAFT_99916 [Epithele typhae]